MEFEYVITRLRALRSRFLPDSDMESIASAREIPSVVLLLEDSVFGEEMQKLKLDGQGDMSRAALARAVEEGRQRITGKAAALVRGWIPQYFDLLFSRRELEQLKEAMRCIRSKEPPSEKGLRFLELSEAGGWTKIWHECRSVGEFKKALVRMRHPMAEGIDETLEGVEAEVALERYYFGEYLQKRERLLADAQDYFSDLNDITNLHSSSLLRGGRHGLAAKKYFAQGPGRLSEKAFLMLTVVSEIELLGHAGKMLGRQLRYIPGQTGFAQSIRQAYLRRWRIGAILEPVGPLGILVFLEELDAMSVNLKLALHLGQAPRLEPEMAGYFLQRRVA